PGSQHGATGLAISAGATLSNMEEWQYGIASTRYRWNLSGTYQQVLPRYISMDENGVEREFLYDALGEASLSRIFLKGYEWPFDTRKIGGSSDVDLLVAAEEKRGRRVYLDYTRNPKGLEHGFGVLSAEAYAYLSRSDALFGTPIERLDRMNRGAIELYASHGIDLWRDRLAIAVSSQHCNGGVMVDAHWESDVRGLYVIGEAAGTFGVYRPGGSALNSTQVGGLRAAEHIARKTRTEAHGVPNAEIPAIRYGESNIASLVGRLRAEMSRVADFDRDSVGMRKLFFEVCALCESFFDVAVIGSRAETAELFRAYDTVLTQRSILSAMLCSAEEIGTHGAARIDGTAAITQDVRKTRTLTRGAESWIAAVSPMPDPELWFETLLLRQRNGGNE
ncbi:MAG: FAD-binding protein, partial [Clostridia bacterium]|nr:FAD-binding protein [Clostridia bacterium]